MPKTPTEAVLDILVKIVVLFVITVLIWGSTWLAIKLHLGVVDPAVSAFYRNTIAAILLFAWCRTKHLSLRFPPLDHLSFAGLGVLLFSGNYYLVYQASALLTSGLVAVVFSTIVFFNIFTARLILGNPIQLRVVLGALLGMTGIGLLFSAELTELSLSDDSVRGLLLALCATLLASFGSILATFMSTRRHLPVIQYNAWGMFYGCVMLLMVTLGSDKEFNYEFTVRYSLALVYLAAFGTAIGFACYLSLLELIGPARAGYTFLMFPVVALLISTFFEGYQWSPTTFIGIGLIVTGSVLALTNSRGHTTNLTTVPAGATIRLPPVTKN